MSIKTYATAVRDTIAAEMRRDPKVFVMGEDVETIGSIFGCTRDLTREFGIERAFNTPISEAGFVGAGLGAACTGMRPIVELMYMDFSFVAMDQLLNQVAKTRYIFGGRAKIPLVIRGQEGIGRGDFHALSGLEGRLSVHRTRRGRPVAHRDSRRQSGHVLRA